VRSNWRDTCLNQLKTTLIVVFCSGETDKTQAYRTVLRVCVTLDLISTPASQAYVERIYCLSGDLNARQSNRASAALEMHAFLKFNSKLLNI